MSTFLLVHGAFRGGWAWSRVRPLLVAAGHDVHAPSLIGAGEHAGRIAEVTSLTVWVDQVATLIELEDLRDVVLVGHSQGALVTTAVAARLPDRIGLLLHLDGAVPSPGQCAADLLPSTGARPPRGASVPAPPVDRSAYGEPWAEWVEARLCDSPVGPALDPMPALPASVREEFAFCARTPAGYPSEATRARVVADGRRIHLVDSDHDAPLTAPAEVARLLMELVAEKNLTVGPVDYRSY